MKSLFRLAFVLGALLLAAPGALAVPTLTFSIQCDAAVGTTQCATVNPDGSQKVSGSVTFPAGSAIVTDSSSSTGYQQLTSLASSTTFTPPALTTFCIITGEAAALRYRTDGTSPTSTVGVPLAIGQSVTFRMSIANLSAIKLIQQASGGIANVDCYKDA